MSGLIQYGPKKNLSYKFAKISANNKLLCVKILLSFFASLT